MEYLFIQRIGDREAVGRIIDELNKYPKEKLIEAYNNQVRIGIVGAHAQAQRIVALNIIFNHVFKRSPIVIQDNVLIKLTGRIVYEKENWIYESNAS
jgi:hypothetical protein